jgi:hypothetical protein
MKPDAENRVRQGLIELKSIPHEETGSRQLLTLTKNGHRFLAHTQSAGQGQALITGLPNPAKPITMPTSTGCIRKRAVKIAGHGDRNLRVVLDYELKKHLYRDLAELAAIPPVANTPLPRVTVSGSFEGRFPCPTFELNMKLAMENGGAWASNLTPVTTGRNLTEKVRAGFSLYAHADDVSMLGRILDQREPTSKILSL